MNSLLPSSQRFEWLEDEPEAPIPKTIFPPRKRTYSVPAEVNDKIKSPVTSPETITSLNNNSNCNNNNNCNSNNNNNNNNNTSQSNDIHTPPSIARVRTLSDAADYYQDQNFLDLIKTTISSRFTEIFVELFARLLPPLRLRSFYFSVALVILSLVIFGHGSNTLSLNGVPPSEWYTFFLQVMATDLAACILDESIFMLIDTYWIGAEEIRLYAHCLNGPLAFILTVSVTNGALSKEQVPSSISNWNPIMSAIITVWTFYTLRQFYQRMNLNKLMVSRFSSRINDMLLDTRILSILAHSVPRRSSETNKTNQIIQSSILHQSDNQNSNIQNNNNNNNHNNNNANNNECSHDKFLSGPITNIPFHENSSQSQSQLLPPPPPPMSPQNYSAKSLPHINQGMTHSRSFTKLSELVDETIDQSKAINTIKNSAFSKHFSNFIHKQRDENSTLHSTNNNDNNIDGHGNQNTTSQSTLSLSEIFSEIVEKSHGNRNLYISSTGSNNTNNNNNNNNNINDDINQQNSFWKKLSEVSTGYLPIDTVNGQLIIRTRKHAISFGNRLYTLLSRGGQKKITGPRISELIQRHVRPDEDVKEIIQRALIIFHLPNENDPDFQNSLLNINTVNDVCVTVFYSRRNIASSLSDFGELRKSLLAVMDILFWIAMVIVVQMIVKIDLESVFAPVLTLIFAISFAVGPIVSNVILAIGYVSFMLPYDVGDRIAVGIGSTRIIGNVSRITLLQTTITTIYNEKLNWPNHVLFSEKVTNLSHSVRAVLEIPISFPLSGPRAITQDQLTNFWSIMKKYILVDEKDKWLDCFIAGHTIDSINNAIGYSFWVTHRASFAQIANLYNSRTKLIEKLYETQRELGIHFAASIQPIERLDGNIDEKFIPKMEGGILGSLNINK